MNWLVWGCLMGAALAGSTLAMSYYLHWSWRHQRRALGLTAEVSAMLLIVFLGSAAITFLLTHRPT